MRMTSGFTYVPRYPHLGPSLFTLSYHEVSHINFPNRYPPIFLSGLSRNPVSCGCAEVAVNYAINCLA